MKVNVVVAQCPHATLRGTFHGTAAHFQPEEGPELQGAFPDLHTQVLYRAATSLYSVSTVRLFGFEQD